jgi:hypothetical protein
MNHIEELEQKVAKFSLIVDELEPNMGYRALLDFWKEEVQGLDDTWQFIPEENGKQRMEARATKMAYMHLLNVIEYLKADIQNTNKIIADLKEKNLSDLSE